jgi:putative radical SAM enzyme (TIGR03279 family)
MEAVIAEVEPGSTGDEIGLAPGDVVLSVDGSPLRDVIDYRFAVAEEQVVLGVRARDGELLEIEVEKDADDTLGITFASPLFDGLRECNNRCVFCFVDQMPSGARATALLHDDDYRMSFLGGNFITLTNLDDEDLERIVRLRLSPLYASIHAWDQGARRSLFRSRNADRALPMLRRLVEEGIAVHTQIVVVPGMNDGAVLEETVRELAALHPGVASIGIVPVGLTYHRADLPALRTLSADDASAILDVLPDWQATYRKRCGTRLCFAADELYLKAHRPIPEPREYEDYPQLENGIGLCALFRQEFRRAARGLAARCSTRVLTGESAAPFVAGLLEEAGVAGDVEVTPVTNTYLGASVTVAGLLAGQDIARALVGSRAELHLVPSVALNDDGRFLDDVPLDSLRPPRGRLLAVGSGREFARAIRKGCDAS